MRPSSVLVAAVCLAPAAAFALTQPNGTPIPSPMGCDGGKPTGLAGELACVCDVPGVCNIGAPCPAPGMCDDGVHAVCETTLWHSFNDNTCIPSNLSGLDPWAEASTTPERFQPTCPLTFTVITRGTARFQNAFGWYNVTGARPAPADLHVVLDCNAHKGDTAVLDILSHPDYAGGEVGFFLVTPEDHGAAGQCAGGNCCASVARAQAGQGRIYYSERAYNPDAMGPSSFIHLLIYDSHVTPQKFYFAWEDTFSAANNDFTDLVTSVEGVECAGGGQSCDTGRPGICAYGVRACHMGQLGCQDLFSPAGELCDGLDNDCDGRVDDGAGCPGADVCHDGRCVPHCDLSDEFECPPDTLCDVGTGLCVSPGCEGVDCPEDRICRGGACVTPCDGVVCPHGQTCRFGECLDPCRAVSCAGGLVCREGVCFPGCDQCGGVGCGAGTTCDTATGECIDPSCPAGCPAGTYCQGGDCLDACDGAVCPKGQVCAGGACVDPDAVPPPSTDGDPGDNPGAGDGPDGCGCAPTSRSTGALALWPLFAGVLLLRRQRRCVDDR